MHERNVTKPTNDQIIDGKHVCQHSIFSASKESDADLDTMKSFGTRKYSYHDDEGPCMWVRY